MNIPVVVVRLPRCIITQREKAKIMTKAGRKYKSINN